MTQAVTSTDDRSSGACAEIGRKPEYVGRGETLRQAQGRLLLHPGLLLHNPVQSLYLTNG